MLSIFDEILHRLVNIATNRAIPPPDATDTALVTVLFLVMVAAVHVALTMRDVLPELA
ncbi:hypothetical protein D3C80_2175610 [compost metagenome]